MSEPAPEPDRLSLFHCAHCGRAIPAKPTEVRAAARVSWPRCCKRDMTLFVSAERPRPGARAVAPEPLVLPTPDPTADTTMSPALCVYKLHE